MTPSPNKKPVILKPEEMIFDKSLLSDTNKSLEKNTVSKPKHSETTKTSPQPIEKTQIQEEKKQEHQEQPTPKTTSSAKVPQQKHSVADQFSKPSSKTNPAPVAIVSGNMTKISDWKPILNQSYHLAEEDLPRKNRFNIFIIFAAIIAFIIWAVVTPVNEVATSPGQIIPVGLIKSIQHLEGGIINEILVKEGDHVQKGQILVRLDGTSFQAELEQAKTRRMSLQIRAERLRSFGMNQQPDYAAFPDVMQPIITDQISIYNMQQKNRIDQRQIINSQVDQQKALLAVQLGQQRDLDQQLKVVKEQRDVNKSLFEKRLKIRSEYLRAEEEVSKVQREFNVILNQMQQTLKAIAEFESRLVELETKLRNEALKEMGSIAGEIAELNDVVGRLEDKVNRLEIKAPSNGLINGLKNTTIRGVIQAGTEILQIVPSDNLEVEAKLNPKDVGYVKSGQNALIKVSSYDFAKYGGIDGVVRSISASTFVDKEEPNAKPYYKVFITLKTSHIKGDKKKVVLPGMVVQADVQTGRKSLLFFLIKPIYIAIESSFHER